MIRTFPSWLSACYFFLGFVTFGAAWLVWWLHALCWYVLVTMPDRRRVRRALTAYEPDEVVTTVVLPADDDHDEVTLTFHTPV